MMEYDLEEIGNEDGSLEANEQELLLLNLTDELLVESITDQINNPSSIFYDKSNYLDTFNTRYNYINTRFKDVPDLLQAVKEAKSEFYANVFKQICDKFGLTLDEDINENDMYVMTTVLYEFLVINYVDNVTGFVIQYILNNKKSIIENFANKDKKLENISLNKKVKNSNDVIILASMYKIVEHIISLGLTTNDILRYIISADEGEFNNYFMNKYFVQEEVITSTKFDDVFFSVLNKENDSYMRMINEIQMEYLRLL